MDFHPTVGGIQRCSAILADYLHRYGVQVQVVTETPSAGCDHFPYPVLRRPTPPQLYRAVRDSDLVHSNGYSLRMLPWAVLLGRPIVYTHAGYQAICPNGLGWYEGMRDVDYHLGRCLVEERRRFGIPGAVRALAKTLAHRWSLPLAASHICLSRIQLARIHPPRAELIYLPCDPALSHMECPRVAGRFAFFGRLVGEKGVDVLLEALALCHARGRQFGLDIFGAGPQRATLVRLAGSLGLGAHVAFWGYRTGEALRGAMNAAWAVVIPSIWEEPGATVAVELLSCGRPVIASRRGATGDIIGECGLLFENGDPSDLAAQMIRLASDPALRHDLEARAPTVAAKYSIAEIGRQHIELYERILHRSRRTSSRNGRPQWSA